MGSLRYFLRELARLNYSLDQIVEQYKEWAYEALFMIRTKWNKEKWRNDVYAVKCAKRGNDVYCSRVESRFAGLKRYSENVGFGKGDYVMVPKGLKCTWKIKKKIKKHYNFS